MGFGCIIPVQGVSIPQLCLPMAFPTTACAGHQLLRCWSLSTISLWLMREAMGVQQHRNKDMDRQSTLLILLVLYGRLVSNALRYLATQWVQQPHLYLLVVTRILWVRFSWRTR